MDMSGMASMTASATASSLAASATSAAAGMDHDMGGMDMGSSCTISMLLNWNTVGSCFISSSWYISSTADYAGSIIGVFLLCIAIEGVRRVGREYDRRLRSQVKSANIAAGKTAPSTRVYSPWPQHLVRSFFYGSQFTAAFFVMLIGMFFNVGMLIAIFLGQTTGYVLFGRDTLQLEESMDDGCCC